MPAARIQRPHGVGGVVLGRRTEAEGSVAAGVKALLAFFDATDEWDDSPLHEELARQLERQGIAGATVLNGIMVFNFAPQQLDYLGRDGFPRSARELHKGNFGPRLGVAYQPMGRTVVRSAYAFVWFQMAGISTSFINPQFPFGQAMGHTSVW